MRGARMLVVLGFVGTLGVFVALGAAPAGSGDGTLYSLRQDGVLRSLDPLTGEVRTIVNLSLPGKVVQNAVGFAVDPRNGDLLALVDFDDDCGADPTRTRFLRSVESCRDLDEAGCETAFETTRPTPVPTSCFWSDLRGCRACTASEGCVNTCVAPPPCEGTTREDFSGAGETACRVHDGDAAGCEGAYGVGAAGPTACFFEDGLCLACDPVAEAAGRCARECAPALACADESRTVYAGGSPGCALFDDDPAGCAVAYEAWDGGSTCAYDDGSCYTGAACAPRVLACPGDPSRTLAPGYCSSFGPDRSSCEGAFALEDDGLAIRGCFFSEERQSCASCSAIDVAERQCIDPCNPPICADDPVRDLAGLDEADCHAFDGDAEACTAAFVQGRCGPAACLYEPADGACRACEPGDPGACENACGAFDVPGDLTLVRIDPATGAATPVRDLAGYFGDLGIDAAGTAYTVAGPGCFEDSVLHDIGPTRARPAALFDVARGDGIAFDAAGGLNRLVQGPLVLARFDMTTGAHTTHPVVSLGVPVPGFTFVAGCDGFVAAEPDGTLSRIEPDGSVHPVAYALPGSGIIAGIAASPDAACPPESPLPTTTTTIPWEALAGTRLVLTDRPGRPGKRRMLMVAKDHGVTLGRGEGSPDDPVTAGASLDVRSTGSDAFDVSYPLDAGGWRRLVRRGELRGYRWSGPPPVTRVVVKRGRLVRIAGRGGALGHSLAADPGGVAIELVLGARPYCLEFGGDVRTRPLRRLVASDAPPPATCRAASRAAPGPERR